MQLVEILSEFVFPRTKYNYLVRTASLLQFFLSQTSSSKNNYTLLIHSKTTSLHIVSLRDMNDFFEYKLVEGLRFY